GDQRAPLPLGGQARAGRGGVPRRPARRARPGSHPPGGAAGQPRVGRPLPAVPGRGAAEAPSLLTGGPPWLAWRRAFPATSCFSNDIRESCRKGAVDMKIRPLQDRVLVKRLEEAEEKPQQGRVIAAGKGKVNEDGKVTPLDVKVGDTVLFGKYSGSEIKIDGVEHLILREDDILGVVEG